MALVRTDNGIYGPCPVLLQQDVEVLVGYQAPFGGIIVKDAPGFAGFIEQPQEWWEAHGYIVALPILEEAQKLGRARSKATLGRLS